MLSAIFLFSLSILSIIHLTSWPIDKTSLGCFIWSWLIFEIWTKPSIPGSNSTKAPKSLILTTFPKTAEPSLYFSSTTLHGSGVSSLILNDNFFVSLSKFIILTSTIWPIFKTSSQDFMWLHEICDKWIKPSTHQLLQKHQNLWIS